MYTVGDIFELCSRKRINFYYDSESMNFELLDNVRVDKMLDRVNVLLDRPILYSIVNNHVRVGIDEYSVNVVYRLLENDEYLYGFYDNGIKYDVKLGWSCNNNCKHCVVKPFLFEIQEREPENIVLDSGFGMWYKKDLSYDDIIELLQENSDVSSVVITGGEPTIRKDLVDILSWIYFNKPHVSVAIQTNGRNLSNIDLVKKIRRFTRDIFFVVAIHGLEKTHNLIVNNRKDKGNPYRETIQGIKNLQEIFNADLRMRTEIVLSNYNYHEIVESVKFQYEDLGIRTIGISYPHLEGFSHDYIDEICPSYEDLFEMLQGLHDYAKDKEDLIIALEEFPECILYQALEEFDHRFEDMCEGHRDGNILVNYLDRHQNDFSYAWLNAHMKGVNCDLCVFNETCVGVWYESFFKNDHILKPVTKEEYYGVV